MMICKKWMRLSAIVLGTVCLVACHDHKHSQTAQKTRHVVTATLQSPKTLLYLTGAIRPLHTVSILSPIDGHIEALHFRYGEMVKQGQLLAVINSTKLMDDFRQAVSGYLEKKASYLIQSQQIRGSRILYKAGVLARNEYLNRENAYQNAAISFFQQKYALQKVLEKAHIDSKLIQTLTLKDTKAIQTLFAKHFNHIKVYTSAPGVALFPLPVPAKEPSQSSDDDQQLVVGSKVKEGELLLSVGDLNGYSISSVVDEVNINQLRVGMAAAVTGDAFPGVTLHGRVTYLASQADPTPSGEGANTGQFKVVVQVTQLPVAAKRVIHIGMTAKVAVSILQHPQVILPLSAVFQQQGRSMVSLLNHKGDVRAVPVVTGQTLPDQVVILSGVQPGDRVVLHD